MGATLTGEALRDAVAKAGWIVTGATDDDGVMAGGADASVIVRPLGDEASIAVKAYATRDRLPAVLSAIRAALGSGEGDEPPGWQAERAALWRFVAAADAVQRRCYCEPYTDEYAAARSALPEPPGEGTTDATR